MVVTMSEAYIRALDCWSDCCEALRAARGDLDKLELAYQVAQITLELTEAEENADNPDV